MSNMPFQPMNNMSPDGTTQGDNPSSKIVITIVLVLLLGVAAAAIAIGSIQALADLHYQALHQATLSASLASLKADGLDMLRAGKGLPVRITDEHARGIHERAKETALRLEETIEEALNVGNPASVSMLKDLQEIGEKQYHMLMEGIESRLAFVERTRHLAAIIEEISARMDEAPATALPVKEKEARQVCVENLAKAFAADSPTGDGLQEALEAFLQTWDEIDRKNDKKLDGKAGEQHDAIMKLTPDLKEIAAKAMMQLKESAAIAGKFALLSDERMMMTEQLCVRAEEDSEEQQMLFEHHMEEAHVILITVAAITIVLGILMAALLARSVSATFQRLQAEAGEGMSGPSSLAAVGDNSLAPRVAELERRLDEFGKY